MTAGDVVAYERWTRPRLMVAPGDVVRCDLFGAALRVALFFVGEPRPVLHGYIRQAVRGVILGACAAGTWGVLERIGPGPTAREGQTRGPGAPPAGVPTLAGDGGSGPSV